MNMEEIRQRINESKVLLTVQPLLVVESISQKTFRAL